MWVRFINFGDTQKRRGSLGGESPGNALKTTTGGRFVSTDDRQNAYVAWNVLIGLVPGML